MIALVMAGGKGTRMNLGNEKLLLKYKKPVILHVIDSLKNSNCFSKILAITSPNSPKTKKLLQENNIEIFDTPGIGYVEDLNLALQNIDEQVLITSGDIPLLHQDII
ncbi:MAG: NTP transferase domain-containing protein, partial [Nitrosopumilus sp.]|nr:NTP transferase domain-containing protein [Nitrosopumilus sp.]